LDKIGAKLLFQIFTEREERKAIAVASTAPFSEWDKTFTDEPGCDHILTEVAVAARVLHSAAELLDVLHCFFTAADPRTRRELGAYLLGNHDIAGTNNPAVVTTIMLASLDEAADLRHTLADNANRSL
jgi:hypothetical protein